MNPFTQDSYSLAFTEQLQNCFSPVIKLQCTDCGYKPASLFCKDALYINEYGVCKDCADRDMVFTEVKSSFDRVIYCPTCKLPARNREEEEFILSEGECPTCEHCRGEMYNIMEMEARDIMAEMEDRGCLEW